MTGPGEQDASSRGILVRVLGGMSALADGRPVELGGRRQRAVLGILVAARGVAVPAGRIVDELWPGGAPAQPAAVLQSYVSHLRRALEPGSAARARASVIVSDGGGYACRLAPGAVDAWQFEDLVRAGVEAGETPAATSALRGALALWRGRPYAEHTGDAWADAEAARLEALRSVAVEQLAAARLAGGDAAVLVPELEVMVAEEPLREDRWRLLALALYRSGRQADALAALRRARDLLVEQLGVDPGPGLRQIEAQILAHDPALTPVAPRPAASGRSSADPGAADDATRRPHASAAEPLVDRTRELAVLTLCLQQACDGQGAVALVDGPAGIGKSRLLAEVRRLGSERGALVLGARGSALEREFGFGVVRQLVEPILADPDRRAELLSGAAGAAAPVVAVAGTDSAGLGDASFSVLHGLYRLVVRLTEDRPVVLAVDDLQWCDVGTLRFLTYLARRAPDLPLLVATTMRTDEVYDDPALLADLAQDPATVTVRPTPLTLAGVADLVRARLGAPDDVFAQACHRTTGGNPLLLRQLLRALEADGVVPDAAHADTVTAIGSRAVSSIVVRRLDRLPGDAVAVARAVSVLGDGCALPAVAVFADLAEVAVAAAIEVLAGAEILRDEYPLGFVHPLVRDAVYRSLAPGRRELAHERAARQLADGGAAPEVVVAHLLQAPPRGEAWVVEALRGAARIATERGAPDSAVAYLRRAMAEPPDPALYVEVLAELGRTESLTDGEAAAVHLVQAYDLLGSGTDRSELAAVAAQTLVFAGTPGMATSFASAAADDVAPEQSEVRQRLEAVARIGGYMHGLDAQVWQHRQVQVEGEGIGARMLAATLAWEKVIACEDRPGAVALARFALDGGLVQDDDPGLFWVVASFVLDTADEDLGTFWDETLARSYARGSLFTALSTHLWHGHAQWWEGDLRDASHSLLGANEQSEAWGGPLVGVSYGESFLIHVLLDRGDVAGARALVDRVGGRARLGDGLRLFDEAAAMLLVAEGRAAAALDVLDVTETLMTSVVNPVWRPWRSYRARALAALGRVDDAVGLVSDELRLARTWGAPRLVGRTVRLLGELRGELRDGDGRDDLEEAVALLRPTRSRLELARALAALARHEAPGAAAALLVEALELAEVCGADTLRARCAADLGRLGQPVPAEPSGAARLAGSERRVARLVADGVGVREIADRLFVTPGLVTAMVADIRRTLGVTDDAGLRAALADATQESRK